MKPQLYQKLFESKTNNAHLISFDNGKDYVVKLYKPKESKALINEWIGYCISRFMGLPIPYSYQVSLPEEFVDQMPNKIGTVNTSKQFMSLYLYDCKNAHEVKPERILNASDLAKIIVFDYWLCNVDRTRKNILLEEVESGAHYLWVIDHADLLGSNDWEVNDFYYLSNTLIKSATHEMMAKFVPSENDFKEAVRVVQTMPIQLLEEMVSFIPHDWNLSKEDGKELIKFLHYRRHTILPLVIGKFIKRVYGTGGTGFAVPETKQN
ncbi:hypothetical protein GCM10008967_39490 [Bacillus carboniphilus]|uniref:HipA-like kinase domain-containing protein n=1 Tax=Bacillus carboniphilus TaxID=86663 RepID=A0ABP3GIY8_9BACI